jgi:hypothetical protein
MNAALHWEYHPPLGVLCPAYVLYAGEHIAGILYDGDKGASWSPSYPRREAHFNFGKIPIHEAKVLSENEYLSYLAGLL